MGGRARGGIGASLRSSIAPRTPATGAPGPGHTDLYPITRPASWSIHPRHHGPGPLLAPRQLPSAPGERGPPRHVRRHGTRSDAPPCGCEKRGPPRGEATAARRKRDNQHGRATRTATLGRGAEALQPRQAPVRFAPGADLPDAPRLQHQRGQPARPRPRSHDIGRRPPVRGGTHALAVARGGLRPRSRSRRRGRRRRPPLDDLHAVRRYPPARHPGRRRCRGDRGPRSTRRRRPRCRGGGSGRRGGFPRGPGSVRVHLAGTGVPSGAAPSRAETRSQGRAAGQEKRDIGGRRAIEGEVRGGREEGGRRGADLSRAPLPAYIPKRALAFVSYGHVCLGECALHTPRIESRLVSEIFERGTPRHSSASACLWFRLRAGGTQRPGPHCHRLSDRSSASATTPRRRPKFSFRGRISPPRRFGILAKGTRTAAKHQSPASNKTYADMKIAFPTTP